MYILPQVTAVKYTIACYMNGYVALILTLCVMCACCVIIGRLTTGACIHCSPRRRDNVGRTICPLFIALLFNQSLNESIAISLVQVQNGGNLGTGIRVLRLPPANSNSSTLFRACALAVGTI